MFRELIYCFLSNIFPVSSPPIIINSNPHLDFSQLNNSLLLHTANSSCQALLSSSSPKHQLTHQFKPVIRHDLTQQQQQTKSFLKENCKRSPLISNYLPIVSTSPKHITPQRPPFVEYTVGHVQVYNQQPRPTSLFCKTPISSSGSKQNYTQEVSSDTKRHTIGCFGNSSPINALYSIICKENGLNGSSVVSSVEENMNNAGSRAKNVQAKKGNETPIQTKRQENGTANDKIPIKMPAIRVKTPVKKGTQETGQDYVR